MTFVLPTDSVGAPATQMPQKSAPIGTHIGTRTSAPRDHTFSGWIDELAFWIGRQQSTELAVRFLRISRIFAVLTDVMLEKFSHSS